MRIRMNESREQRLTMLQEATGENTKSKAIDQAVIFYLKMGATDMGMPAGNVQKLMKTAAERGSLTPAEIAEILDTPQLPVSASTSYSVGTE